MPLAAALDAPLLHGFSPVRRLRRRTSPLSTALLAGPDSPQRGTAPGPARRSWCASTSTSVPLAKPWSGVRRQRHCAALRTAERMAARAQRAPQHLTRVDCPSTANAVSGASFDAGHAIEDRKGSGAKRRTPYTSAGVYPAAALPRSIRRRRHQHESTTLAVKHSIRTAAATRAGAGLPHQAGEDRRALHRRQRHRHPGAHRGAEAQRDVEPVGADREPARCRRHDRGRRGRQVGARRHDADGAFVGARGQCVHLSHAAVRHAEGFRAGGAARRPAQCVGHRRPPAATRPWPT